MVKWQCGDQQLVWQIKCVDQQLVWKTKCGDQQLVWQTKCADQKLPQSNLQPILPSQQPGGGKTDQSFQQQLTLQPICFLQNHQLLEVQSTLSQLAPPFSQKPEGAQQGTGVSSGFSHQDMHVAPPQDLLCPRALLLVGLLTSQLSKIHLSRLFPPLPRL